MKTDVAVDIKGRIAALMGDNRERTIDDIANRISARREAVALAAERLLDLGLLRSERRSNVLTYSAKPLGDMNDAQIDKYLAAIPFRHRKQA